jgi:hypothetical protein
VTVGPWARRLFDHFKEQRIMATKTASKAATGRKAAGAKRSRAKPGGAQAGTAGAGARASARPSAPSDAAANPFAAMGDPAQMARLREMMTPEQAFELYRQNARLALDIIDAAIESTAKMRKLQFEGEEEARALQKRAARRAAEAENPQALVASSHTDGQEAVHTAMT